MRLSLHALALAFAAAVPSADAACRASSPDHTIALVELFTSQGCSSCPPADRWLSRLAKEAPAHRAVPLALHVGYWDYIGWKDPFARREFNARQSRLAAANGSRSVYTPGVFVQGRETRWSQPAAFEAELNAVNRRPAAARIVLDQVAGQGQRIEFRAQAESTNAVSKDAQLYVALVQNGLSTAVSAGENRGETLVNDRVTRAWTGPLPLGTRTLSLQAPTAAMAELTLVAFVEDASGVLQALQLPLADCRAG
jgi:hypothetical protein